ncbi:MAG: hypothetical protein R3341_10350 [Methylophaga sp.]|nr:hypothetical protein [Methylophaga sp.]
MNRAKKMLFISIAAALLLMCVMLLHNAYAGKPFISLNSPVSFPVDI